MNTNRVKRAVFAITLTCLLSAVLMSGGSPTEAEAGLSSTGKADPAILRAGYEQWKTEYLKNGGDSNLILALHWSKGLSDETIKGSGHVKIDMTSGNIAAAVTGLSTAEGWDLWLIQNLPETSIMPEQEDTLIKVGTLKPDGKYLKLEAALGSETFASLRPDMAVVTRVGKGPDESRILIATTSLFHSLYWNTYPGQFGVMGHAARAKAKSGERGFFSRLIGALLPIAQAQKIEGDPLVVSIEEGKRLFFEEQFSGNTRTCGTCHPAGNNFTIDPTFISTLHPLDPLFIAENDPNLAALENPRVMRGTGNILENVDGFQNPGVLRAVPHTLALGLSDRPDTTVQSGGFSNALGWSGDGSPTGETLTILLNPPPSTQTIQHLTTGSLRDFALGAVRQHFPKRLNRVPNVDFRFPSLSELNDMEAFQLSLGRMQELQLDPAAHGVLRLRNGLAAQGQVFFRQTFGASACNNCHFNAGANTGVPPNDINANFNTRVERLPLQPARLIDPTIPLDGGFGTAPFPEGGLGNGRFNTPPLVEAADTPPFFHNNSINTIELAVQFYEFSFGPTQVPANQVSFQLNQGFGTAQIQAIASFLRVINALENVRSAVDLENRAIVEKELANAAPLLALSIEELEDAIEVLSDGSLHPTAISLLRDAVKLDRIAMEEQDQDARNVLIREAICLKQAARGDMQIGTFLCIAPNA